MKTTVVGSFPVPSWLMSHPSPETLEDALHLVLRLQEEAGIDVICDGELNRWDAASGKPVGMVERFTREMGGIDSVLNREQLAAYRSRGEMAYRRSPAGIVNGPVDEGTLDLAGELEKVTSLTSCPVKLTVTSPYMMARALADTHYGSLEAVAMALADVLAAQLNGMRAAASAAAVQVDEPNLPGNPDHGPIAAESINRVLESIEGTCEKAVHLCFGNYGGQRIQEGDYSRLIAFMSSLHCDHLILETTRRPDQELDSLCGLPEHLRFGWGVIDVKDLHVETPDIVARRIEDAARRVGESRLAYVNPDCGLRMLPRDVALGKLKALKAGRDLFTGDSSPD